MGRVWKSLARGHSFSNGKNEQRQLPVFRDVQMLQLTRTILSCNRTDLNNSRINKYLRTKRMKQYRIYNLFENETNEPSHYSRRLVV